MTIMKIAINGFGRIGRNVLRAWGAAPRSDVEIVAINDLADIDNAAFLLEFDSVHGRLSSPVSHEGDMIKTSFGDIRYLSERDPSNIDWAALGVDVVFECTGIFTSAEKAAVHLAGGAKKVLVSAPSAGADLTVVYGVNHEAITAEHKIISNASCTTNCLAPIAHVLQNTCGIKQGFMTTIHSYTGDQRLLDAEHKDRYRARAAALNMIPTTTGAAKAVGLVLPELAGKLDGVAIRVPTPNVSAVDLVFEPARAITAAEINAALREASAGALAGILDVTDRELVSSDLNGDPASSIAHLDQTRVMPDGMARVFSWYDNEWGFSNRMLDTAAALKF
ncbi:type I glyceraldehyde-3-phosphate dehydrogenase [Alphaproteobacteria bacterium]|nr:type I glyceraldehyde-3-phosphate dehydrogenase [Alphaproteobacteria bacterium]